MKTVANYGLRLLVTTALAIVAGIVILAIRNRPLDPAEEHGFVHPTFEGLPKGSVCWIEFDHNEVPGQFATAGVTKRKKWEITASGLFIHYPKGVVLVDTGSSSHFQDEIVNYPFWSHLHFEILTGGKSAAHPASEVLRAAGVDPAKLSYVLPSHIHMDHAGGLIDIPNVPVLLAQDEFNFMERNRDSKTIQVVPAQAKAIEGRVHPLRFEPKPYENFDESADLFGDGSVVVVKLPGHTPGSVGSFVNVSPSLRIFHVGDAVNVTEAVDRRLPKSFLMATTDNDVHQADLTVAKLNQLHNQDPGVMIVPAHDRVAWERVFGPSPRCIP